MEELIFIKKKVGRSETDVSVNTETHTGDYALKYDEDRNLHYIECE